MLLTIIMILIMLVGITLQILGGVVAFMLGSWAGLMAWGVFLTIFNVIVCHWWTEDPEVMRRTE